MLKLCHIRTECNTLMIYRYKHHHLKTIYRCSLFDRLRHKPIDRQKEIFMIRTAANLIATCSAREKIGMLTVFATQS